MRKLLLFLFALLLPITANAATCNAGYYNDNGTCTLCPAGYACTNGVMTKCGGLGPHGRPTYTNAAGGASACTECPEIQQSLQNRLRYYFYFPYTYDRGITSCIASIYDDDPDGTYTINAWYGNDNYGMGTIQTHLPEECIAGKYSTLESAPEWGALGDGAAVCYGNIDCMNGRVCTDVDAGYYSPDGDTEQHACTTPPANAHITTACTASANTAWVCDAGYWLNGNGECELCPRGNNLTPATYCPGDNTKHACPTSNVDYYAKTGYHNVTNDPDADAKLCAVTGWEPCNLLLLGEASWIPGNATAAQLTSDYSCRGRLIMADDNGNLFLNENQWNGEYYWIEGNKWWFYAVPGYYLSERSGSTWLDSYNYVKPCENTPPAHAHFTEWTEPNNPNCAWECDAGYGLYNGVCHARCPYGDGELHVGQYTHPLWADITNVPSPSVYIGELGPNHDGLCYAYLEPDDTPVDNHHGFHTVHNGVPYHAINLGLYGLE